jgi:hypothetical protein
MVLAGRSGKISWLSSIVDRGGRCACDKRDKRRSGIHFEKQKIERDIKRSAPSDARYNYNSHLSNNSIHLRRRIRYYNCTKNILLLLYTHTYATVKKCPPFFALLNTNCIVASALCGPRSCLEASLQPLTCLRKALA